MVLEAEARGLLSEAVPSFPAPQQDPGHMARRHSIRAADLGADDPARPVTPADVVDRFALFGNCCAYCGNDADPLTLEHVAPLSRGGLHVPENLAPACASCNGSKGARTVGEWYLSQPFFTLDRFALLQGLAPSAVAA